MFWLNTSMNKTRKRDSWEIVRKHIKMIVVILEGKRGFIFANSPPHPWFPFPGFQLSVVNHGPKILDGEFQK